MKCLLNLFLYCGATAKPEQIHGFGIEIYLESDLEFKVGKKTGNFI